MRSLSRMCPCRRKTDYAILNPATSFCYANDEVRDEESQGQIFNCNKRLCVAGNTWTGARKHPPIDAG